MVGKPGRSGGARANSGAHVKVRARLPAVAVCVRVLVDFQARPIQLSLRRA